MRGTKVLLCLGLLLVAGCGKRESLQPAAGGALPVTARTARVQPTVDDLLTPTAVQRPGRAEEVLRKSEQRQEDRFDLPPPE